MADHDDHDAMVEVLEEARRRKREVAALMRSARAVLECSSFQEAEFSRSVCPGCRKRCDEQLHNG